jgi:chemotaxis methyl-accepting protein methylase
MERATQSNPAKPDRAPPLPHAGCTLEEVARAAVRVRQRVHLDGGGRECQLEGQARRMPRFGQFDLRQSMRTKGPLDAVFRRNVPICFNLETRPRIPRQIRDAMFRQGHPLPGGAETAFNVDDQFQRKTIGQAVLYQAP